MPAKAYIGDENGIAQAVSKLYIGDENGIAQRVVKAYIGDENGIAQLCYSGDVEVTLTGLTNNVYCSIKGTNYNNGDVTLNLPIGTPIDICFGSVGNTQVYVNNSGDDVSYALQNCDKFRYVVTGEVSINCTITVGAITTSCKAIITEDALISNCFRVRTTWSTGEVTINGYAYRKGMTWRKFIDSMYNDGEFIRTSGDSTVSYRRDGRKLLNPTDDDYSGGHPVSENDTIYNLHTYI